MAADLRPANLEAADLAGAQLWKANPHGAQLSGADLRGAYLASADLQGADLRGAVLAGHLVDRGIAFNGIVLISTAVDIRSIDFLPGDDQSYVLFVPTYAATAWYHGKLDAELQQRSLPELTAEVTDWAENQLAPALLKGDRLGAQERQEIAARLARYTELSLEYAVGANLRVEIMRFRKELLRAEKRSVGRADSGYKGIEGLAVNEQPEFDAAGSATTPAYTASLNHHVRSELGVETDLNYHVSGPKIYDKWEWEKGRPRSATARR